MYFYVCVCNLFSEKCLPYGFYMIMWMLCFFLRHDEIDFSFQGYLKIVGRASETFSQWFTYLFSLLSMISWAMTWFGGPTMNFLFIGLLNDVNETQRKQAMSQNVQTTKKNA